MPRLDSLVFFCRRRVYGGSCKASPFRGYQSCRFAWHPWHVLLTCLQKCRKLFCVAGAILVCRFQKMSCSSRGKCSTLETSIVIWRRRRSTLAESRCVIFANRIVRAASSGDNMQIAWQVWNKNLHCTLCTSHSTLYTVHSTLYTPHSALYTLHSALCTTL